MKGIFFDLDDTLVDTSQSFDVVVLELVKRHGTRATSREELHQIRAQGGFNDDWDSVVELLRLQGKSVEREHMAQEGLSLYLELAAEVETLMVEREFLESLGSTLPLFVVTGRDRAEYEPVWGERLDPLFKEVVCRNDRPALPPKPSPAQVQDLMKRWKISSGLFVGNSVDDMRAGKGAGLIPVGICTNQTAETLTAAGAEVVLKTPGEYHRLMDILR